jgi:hypothetical protein
MALWDKILSSIRVRPTAPARTSAAEPLAPPLGIRAVAGQACPHDGWWECAAAGDGVRVQGGRRQYFQQGQRMPQALLLPPQTVWEKLRGRQTSYQAGTPTAWTLADKRSRNREAPTVPLADAAMATSGLADEALVGDRLMTGSPCPASGWWRCEEAQALDGARWFARGTLLPSATFAVSAHARAGQPDRPQTIQRRAAWRLVRRAEAPFSA